MSNIAQETLAELNAYTHNQLMMCEKEYLVDFIEYLQITLNETADTKVKSNKWRELIVDVVKTEYYNPWWIQDGASDRVVQEQFKEYLKELQASESEEESDKEDS